MLRRLEIESRTNMGGTWLLTSMMILTLGASACPAAAAAPSTPTLSTPIHPYTLTQPSTLTPPHPSPSSFKTPTANILADYDAELRKPDGRVDLDRMLDRLKTLGVNTYFWLIWHSPTDWDDLKRFLPRAAVAGIKVWVYIVPPSESPPNTTLYSEPFRLDYPRWAEEIAKLSLRYPNLAGWVMDDFYANRSLFTPLYMKDLGARTRQINPGLAFLPIMYFPEITHRFAEDYRNTCDGVIVAYLQDKNEIEQTRAVLDDRYLKPPGILLFPSGVPSHPGDFLMVSQQAAVTPAKNYLLRFHQHDTFTGPTSGYHFKQLLVDNTVVWEEDVAADPGQEDVQVDITPQVIHKPSVTLSFRLKDQKGVSNFGVQWHLRDLQTEGFKLESGLDHPEGWQISQKGSFEAGFGANIRSSGRFHIPFISMVAADKGEFAQRHGDPTPKRIAQWVRVSLDAWQQGECDGVVTYCLDKSPNSPTFPLVQGLFSDYGGTKD